LVSEFSNKIDKKSDVMNKKQDKMHYFLRFID